MVRTRTHEAAVVGVLAAFATFCALEARGGQPHSVVGQSTDRTATTGRRPIAERIKAANRPIRILSEEQLAPDEGLIRKLAEERHSAAESGAEQLPVVVELPAGLLPSVAVDTGAGTPPAEVGVAVEPAVVPPPEGVALPTRPVSSEGDLDVRETATVDETGAVEQAELEAPSSSPVAAPPKSVPAARRKPVVIARPRELTPLERFQSRLAEIPRPFGLVPAPRPASSRPSAGRNRGQAAVPNQASRNRPGSGTTPTTSVPDSDGSETLVQGDPESVSPTTEAMDSGVADPVAVDVGTESVAVVESSDETVVSDDTVVEDDPSTLVAASDTRADTSTPIPEPVVVCDVKGPDRTLAPGERAELTCVVRNVGGTRAENVAVTIFFAEGLEPVAVAGRSADIFEGQVRFVTVGSIPPGGELPLKVAATARVAGNHAYRAHVRHVGTNAAVIGDGIVRAVSPDSSPESVVTAGVGRPEASVDVAATGQVAQESPVVDSEPKTVVATEPSETVAAGDMPETVAAIDARPVVEDITAVESDAVVDDGTQIDVSMEVPEGNVRQGERFEIRFKVCNTGERSVLAVSPMFHFGEGIEPVAVSGGNAEVTPEGSVLFEKLTAIAPGASAEFAIVATCHEVGTARFQGVVWCGEGDAAEQVPVDGELRVVPARIATAPEGRTRR